MDAVRAHEGELTRYAIERLLEAGATVFGPKDVEHRGGAVCFWYRDVHPHDLAPILNEEGVAIRAGHHCAQLVMRRFGTPATARARSTCTTRPTRSTCWSRRSPRRSDVFAV